MKNHILKQQNYFRTFFDQCRNNPNKPHNIPNEIKAYLKKKALEQGLNAKVVISSKRSLRIKMKGKRKRPRNNFQGQSEISRRWFDLDYEWSEKHSGHMN